ncbi:SDR family oxidoreductase [Paenibacillus sp. NFR01]|uniref:SDR family oxidoreductase n=1 Tax=Paenibacillus sp. NFR01 TaxID=1566279 RepID=UPI0008AABD30|nr:SDR family oxidoreductase [Paenibacillus sp. NFR01]SEU02341.1 Nucleoside-diphosphate-sugar epimerase [Paenibacillus sp. NFR01]
MRVFVTGATGFIGSAIVQELLAAGHGVIGLARSEQAAQALLAAGADVHRGSLDDPDSLKRGAAAAEGVIHTAYNHDFGNMSAAGELDVLAVEALGAALVGTGKPLVVTSVISHLAKGRVCTEADEPDGGSAVKHRSAAEEAGLKLADADVRVSVVRLPPSVHGEGDRSGFLPAVIRTALQAGASAYVGDGTNRWSAVHRLDAARLYRLALESAPAGARLHAIGDEGVSFRAIAEAVGRRLDLPAICISPPEAAGHFGWLAHFAAQDVPASSKLTQALLGWQPVHPGILADLEQEFYYRS